MSIILKELKERKSLGLITHQVPTKEDVISIKEGMAKAARTQKSLGLGNPSRALASIEKQVEIHAKFEKAKPLAIELAKRGFVSVESPSEKLFPRVEPGATITLGKLPKFVMARLTKDVADVKCRTQASMGWNAQNGLWTAQLPLMPTSVQEMAKRAKEIAPGGKFHLLFEPSWQRVPEPVRQRDPVLLYEKAARFFVVGYWDKDADLINEELKEITIQE